MRGKGAGERPLLGAVRARRATGGRGGARSSESRPASAERGRERPDFLQQSGPSGTSWDGSRKEKGETESGRAARTAPGFGQRCAALRCTAWHRRARKGAAPYGRTWAGRERGNALRNRAESAWRRQHGPADGAPQPRPRRLPAPSTALTRAAALPPPIAVRTRSSTAAPRGPGRRRREGRGWGLGPTDRGGAMVICGAGAGGSGEKRRNRERRGRHRGGAGAERGGAAWGAGLGRRRRGRCGRRVRVREMSVGRAGSGGQREKSAVSLLGLLAKIKCSICSYQFNI